MVWVNLGERSGPEYMESFRIALERLGQGGSDESLKTDRLASAMASLVGLGVRLHNEPDADWITQDMPAFRVRARELLKEHRPILSRYIAGMETSIWEGTPEGWYNASVRRSAVQIIIDELDRDDEQLIERKRISEDDDDMRQEAPDMEPLPPDVIPALPHSHWWWWAPGKPAS